MDKKHEPTGEINLQLMADESFPCDPMEESFAIWYTNECGRWNEFAIYHHEEHGALAGETCERRILELRRAMPYRKFLTIKIKTINSIELIE